MWIYNKNNEIIDKLCLHWDINKPYWYPLFDCNRNDVISFNSDYIQSNIFKKILRVKGIKEIYEYREDGNITLITDITEYSFWDSDDYFWINECFWFDLNNDWIIYKSHEGTTTIGGLWLINEFKKEIIDWKSCLKWDKNKFLT